MQVSTGQINSKPMQNMEFTATSFHTDFISTLEIQRYDFISHLCSRTRKRFKSPTYMDPFPNWGRYY